MLILEDLEFAQERGAPILAELVGYGCTGDAYHETSPAPGGCRLWYGRCVVPCKKQACEPEEVDYINAHGTSTEPIMMPMRQKLLKPALEIMLIVLQSALPSR